MVVGPMGPCGLGKDKLKRPKRWSDWRKDAENKMRFLKIEEDKQKLSFIRSCAGAELTEFWEKEVRARFEAKVEEGARVEAHTYEQVVDDTKQTLLKLVSKDRAIIDLLRLEQGNKSIAFAGRRQPPLRSNRLPALNQSDWRAILTVQSDSASVA